MPKYKVHIGFGLIVYLLIIIIVKVFVPLRNNSILYLFSCIAGSVFPDIDTKSKIQKLVYFILFGILIITILQQQWIVAAFIGLISFIPLLVNHRKLTHQVWFIILIPLIIPITFYSYNKNYLIPAFLNYLFFIAGSFSHILLDFRKKFISKK